MTTPNLDDNFDDVEEWAVKANAIRLSCLEHIEATGIPPDLAVQIMLHCFETALTILLGHPPDPSELKLLTGRR